MCTCALLSISIYVNLLPQSQIQNVHHSLTVLYPPYKKGNSFQNGKIFSFRRQKDHIKIG